MSVNNNIEAANIFLGMGSYRRAIVHIHTALEILKSQRNNIDFINVGLDFAKKLLAFYKIYWADDVCMHIISICDDVLKVSAHLFRTSQSPRSLFEHNREAVKVKFDTLVLLINIYKNKQPNDAIALTKILAELIREKTHLLYGFPKDSLALSFIPENSALPLIDVYEGEILNGETFYLNKSLQLLHLYSLNIFIGILHSLQNTHAPYSYYIQALALLAKYAAKLESYGKMTKTELTIFEETDKKLKAKVEALHRKKIEESIAKIQAL
jgi:hypothetical protein